MKHPRKEGRVIIDKDIKFIKKLLKKNPIIFEGHISTKDDCLVEVTNIRKYKDGNRLFKDRPKFVFEVDVKIKKTESSRWRLYGRIQCNNRKVRSWRMGKLFQDELCYFGIQDLCVSKISYE